MIKYFNGCLFHNVQKDFIAQTGEPTGKGTGGSSIYKFLYGDQARFFDDEIHPDLKHSNVGTVAMANAGENLNASQFYITLCKDLDYLDGKHTVFGQVEEGLEVLKRINEAYVDENGRPYKNIRIKHTYIIDDPFDDPPQLAELVPDKSPEGKPAEEVEGVCLEDDWVPLDEKMGPAELEEAIRGREAHSHAVVLETIGDIPDAEIKPPENVLFVCKLNPVTQDEDLDTIFSRFGNVLSAEIIRDYKTGDSLCYAFIEFEIKESCEQAYFKMDNALIDDRRIHVDFSQSVAKQWADYRRHGRYYGSRGGGCFKCGKNDHVAKYCPESRDEVQASKYTLKDENRQCGSQKSYDMVFEEDNLVCSEVKGRVDHDKECAKEMQKRDGVHYKNCGVDRSHADKKRMKIGNGAYHKRDEESRSQSRKENQNKLDGSGKSSWPDGKGSRHYSQDGNLLSKRCEEEQASNNRKILKGGSITYLGKGSHDRGEHGRDHYDGRHRSYKREEHHEKRRDHSDHMRHESSGKEYHRSSHGDTRGKCR